jgi:hypothetical protein
MADSSPERTDSELLGGDERRYVLHPESTTAHVKETFEKEYCHAKVPGEEHFHLLVAGEIYLETNGERFCLNCAIRRGDLTPNRLHWKRGD